MPCRPSRGCARPGLRPGPRLDVDAPEYAVEEAPAGTHGTVALLREEELVAASVHHGGHDVLDHDAHGADHHDDHHAPAHGFIVKTDSPVLIVVPIMILAVLSLISGYLNAAPFDIEKFTEWVAPVAGEFFPELTHATFKWVNALPSVVLVAAGFCQPRCVQGDLRGAGHRGQGPHPAQPL